MRRHSLRGNGNRAVWRTIEVRDGALYRLPTGELARASVVPHPDALPEYWTETPSGGEARPVGEGLTLSLVWPEGACDASPDVAAETAHGATPAGAPGSVIGPAQVTFLTAACVAGVEWADGRYVFDVEATPELVRRHGERSDGPGWPLYALKAVGGGAEEEFEEAVQVAERGLHKLLSIKERIERERHGRERHGNEGLGGDRP